MDIPMPTFLTALRRFAGIGANSTDHLEKWVSGLGALTGILGVVLVSQTYLGLNGGTGLIASMGASAVLLFAVPHGPLSQPWAVFGGHLVSAIIGVACTRLGLDYVTTTALAVALAVTAMYYLRCIHPPGGATALTAVAGGESVHAMGFNFVLTPVLLNVLVILSVAILFNLALSWRRYPAAWARKPKPTAEHDDIEHADEVFSRAALTTAANAIDPALGIGKHNVETLCSLARCHTEAGCVEPAGICVGSYYSNGAFGPDWQVRLVTDCNKSTTPESNTESILSYRVVAGNKRRQMGTASRTTFAEWARYEVYRNENSWQRTDITPCAIEMDTAA